MSGELSNGWLRVAMTPPPREVWIHVWHQGRIALGKYCPQFPVPGVHDWLLLPPRRNPHAPFPAYHPKWWRPQPDPPIGETGAEDPFPDTGGEGVVRWRGSVSDLVTDLRALLSLDQVEELSVSLVYLAVGEKLEVERAAKPRIAELESRLTEAAARAEASLKALDRGDGPMCRQHLRETLAQLSSERTDGGQLGTDLGRSPPRAQSPEPASVASLPLPLLLWCPECNERHVDVGDFATKPHHTHACQFCGHVWRPAIAPTTGVQFLPGFKNEPEPASSRSPALGRRAPEESPGETPAGSSNAETDLRELGDRLEKIRRRARSFRDGQLDQLDASEIFLLCGPNYCPGCLAQFPLVEGLLPIHCSRCGRIRDSFADRVAQERRAEGGEQKPVLGRYPASNVGQPGVPHHVTDTEARSQAPSRFWCPATRGRCERPCAGSTCLLSAEHPSVVCSKIRLERCPKCERAWNEAHALDCPEREF